MHASSCHIWVETLWLERGGHRTARDRVKTWHIPLCHMDRGISAAKLLHTATGTDGDRTDPEKRGCEIPWGLSCTNLAAEKSSARFVMGVCLSPYRGNVRFAFISCRASPKKARVCEKKRCCGAAAARWRPRHRLCGTAPTTQGGRRSQSSALPTAATPGSSSLARKRERRPPSSRR